MTENNFKTRYYNQKLSFNDRKHFHAMVLSKHISKEKDRNTRYNLKWRIIKRANAYRGNPSAATYAYPRNCAFYPPAPLLY